MPTANNLSNIAKINFLIYGKPRTKKTWWAIKFAEAGFNIIHLCMDVGGYNIVKQISEEARNRIYIVDISDTLDRPVAPLFFNKLLKEEYDEQRVLKPSKFYWNENNKTIIPTIGGLKADNSYVEIDIRKITKNEIIIIDSWTAFIWSLQWYYAIKTNFDFSVPPPEWEIRSEFGWTRQFATWAYKQLQSLPCHLIIIAHEDRYEKRKLVKDERTGKNKEEIEWVKTQIKSTSGNHATQMPADFEMFRFVLFANEFHIDARPSTEFDCGSRIIAPALWKWDNLSPTVVCKELNISPPSDINPPTAFKFYNRGDEHPQFGGLQKSIAQTAAAKANLLEASKVKPVLQFGKPKPKGAVQ